METWLTPEEKRRGGAGRGLPARAPGGAQSLAAERAAAERFAGSEHPLHEAARAGDAEAVEAIVAQRARGSPYSYR